MKFLDIISLLLIIILVERCRSSKKMRCSTSEEDAKINMEVADEIVDNPILPKSYGTFPIGEHGVFTMNSAAGEKTITAKKNLPPTRER